MGIYLPFLVIYCLSRMTTSTASRPVRRDYCEKETFNASCRENEAIIMETALYGRMRPGRCTSTLDISNVPCEYDALKQMDGWCSGRQSCSVPVSNLVRYSNCHKDLRSYLEASYTCVPVLTSRGDCRGGVGPTPVSPTSGYISSALSRSFGCGFNESPWRVKVPKGQTIQFTLYDFSLSSLHGEDSNTQDTPGICLVFATIKDASTEAVCGGKQRTSRVHESSTNEVEVRLRVENLDRANEDGQLHFLLKYEAAGCSDPEVRPFSWFKRTSDNEVVIGCNMSSTTWTLACNNHRWVGNIGECPSSGKNIDDIKSSNVLFGSSAMSGSLSVIIIVGIAVCVGLFILLMGIICIRKRRMRSDAPQYGTTTHYTDNQPMKAYSKSTAGKFYQPDSAYYSENANSYYPTWNTQGQSQIQGQQLSENYTGSAVPPSSLALSDSSSKNGSKYFDHVYESPHFERREFQAPVNKEAKDPSKYFELEPKMTPSKVDPTKGSRDTAPDLMHSYVSGRYST